MQMESNSSSAPVEELTRLLVSIQSQAGSSGPPSAHEPINGASSEYHDGVPGKISSDTGNGISPGPQLRSAIWQTAASIGAELANPMTLGSIAGEWDRLDESVKLAVMFGIVHMGKDKMRMAQAEVAVLARLARTDAASGWVRTIGALLGAVGETGRISSERPAELAHAADMVERALNRSLHLPPRCLEYVSPAVARTIATDPVLYIYGRPPDADELEQVRADAAKAPAARHAPPRAQNDPDPAELAFTNLFSDRHEDPMEVSADAARLSVRSTHAADHAGRMSRLLAAARNAKPAGSTHARVQGAQPRRSANKLGMLVPRRRTAVPANTALPASGLGSTPRLRSSEQNQSPFGGYQQEKRIKMMNFEESATTMQARDQTLKERKERQVEEREAKRRLRQAEIEERKRAREEARAQKKAAMEARVSARRKHKDSDDEYDGRESGEASEIPASPDSQPLALLHEKTHVDSLPEYMTFSGNGPQVQAVYSDTNALTDHDRLLMYNFFNSKPMPPGTRPMLSIVLNEKTVRDPSNQNAMCRELMVFQADLNKGEWKKIRRYRRS